MFRQPAYVSGWAALRCRVCIDLPAGELSRYRGGLVRDALRKLKVLLVQTALGLRDEALGRVVLSPRFLVERAIVDAIQVGVGAPEQCPNRPLELDFGVG